MKAENETTRQVVELSATPGAPADPHARLLSTIAKSKNMKVALVVIGEMGHVIPIVRLASALEERGHQTTIMTFSYAKEKA